MSTRTYLGPQLVLTAGAMVGDLTSAPTILHSLTKAGYAFSWSGSTPIGTVSVQVSNDYALAANGAVANAGTWTTIAVSYNGTTVTAVPVSGNTGNGFIDVNGTAAYAIRAIYTHSSGTGSLNITFVGKVS